MKIFKSSGRSFATISSSEASTGRSVKGGYPSSGRTIDQLPPPPKGPAPISVTDRLRAQELYDMSDRLRALADEILGVSRG